MMRAAYNNIDSLSKSQYGSCYYCLKYSQIKEEDKIYSNKKGNPVLPPDYIPVDEILFIEEYIDGHCTALCPHCYIDSVVPGIVCQTKLQDLNKYWFTPITKNKVSVYSPN